MPADTPNTLIEKNPDGSATIKIADMRKVDWEAVSGVVAEDFEEGPNGSLHIGKDAKLDIINVEGKIKKEIDDARKAKTGIGIDYKKYDAELFEVFEKGGRLKIVRDGENIVSIDPILEKSVEKRLAEVAEDIYKKHGTKNLIIEVAEGVAKVFKKKETDKFKPELQLEYAEDDRVIGIPHVTAQAGDKIYIINGRIMTGWSMYFSLTAIRSPEDYGRNVDLAYNVPYIWGAFKLKGQLGLGAPINVIMKKQTQVDWEERLSFIKNLISGTLKIDSAKRKKTAAHLSIYGNAMWHIRRNEMGIPDKVTILQPERIKIFLDPMTAKILFYIYLPPIIGGTVLVPYPSIRANPSIISNIALTYPTPIIIPTEDIIHFKENAYTEYPFGYSDLKCCFDPATARLDINIVAPIIYKHYAKPMVHWRIKTEGLNPKQVNTKISAMVSKLETMEPASDPVTTDRWEALPIAAPQSQNALLELTQDVDQQLFASIGVPESYFKPRGSTDRNVVESDKVFLGLMSNQQLDWVAMLMEKLIKPAIDVMYPDTLLRTILPQVTEDELYPTIEFMKSFQQDETIEIANAISLKDAGLISPERAAERVGERFDPIAMQQMMMQQQAMMNGGTPVQEGEVPPEQQTEQPQGQEVPANSSMNEPEFADLSILQEMVGEETIIKVKKVEAEFAESPVNQEIAGDETVIKVKRKKK